MEKQKLYWEEIERQEFDNSYDYGSELITERCRVPGGWLVRTVIIDNPYGSGPSKYVSVSTVYVPTYINGHSNPWNI